MGSGNIRSPHSKIRASVREHRAFLRSSCRDICILRGSCIRVVYPLSFAFVRALSETLDARAIFSVAFISGLDFQCQGSSIPSILADVLRNALNEQAPEVARGMLV